MPHAAVRFARVTMDPAAGQILLPARRRSPGTQTSTTLRLGQRPSIDDISAPGFAGQCRSDARRVVSLLILAFGLGRPEQDGVGGCGVCQLNSECQDTRRFSNRQGARSCAAVPREGASHCCILGFEVRTKALMNLPSTSFAMALTSIRCAVRN